MKSMKKVKVILKAMGKRTTDSWTQNQVRRIKRPIFVQGFLLQLPSALGAEMHVRKQRIDVIHPQIGAL